MRSSAAARKRGRPPRWVAWLPIPAACLFLLYVLFRASGQGTSPILAKQAGEGTPIEALPARPEQAPAAPGALAAVPAKLVPARLQPPKPHAPDLPKAPSMLTVPQEPRVAAAPVVQAPVLPAPPPAPPQPAPSLLTAPVKPPEPAPPVTSAPVQPAPAAPVTGAQGWKETPIDQERPVVRIYNTAGDDGQSRVFLTNGRSRYRVQIRNPYGEVTLAPGNYRYELYVSGSAMGPAPDQVGVLRCQKYTQYSLEFFRTPFARTRQEDLGDELPDPR